MGEGQSGPRPGAALSIPLFTGFIPITVDDAALPEAISGVVLPSVAIHNPKSKIQNGITGGQTIRANVVCTALERPRAWLCQG